MRAEDGGKAGGKQGLVRERERELSGAEDREVAWGGVGANRSLHPHPDGGPGPDAGSFSVLSAAS